LIGPLIEKATCAALRFGSAAISIAIVYQAGTARAGTSETAPLVVAAIGVLAAVFSMTAVPKARRAWRDGDRAIAALFIGGLLVSEPYLVSYEIAWWEQNVSAAQARQKAKQVASADRDEAISRAQETLRTLKGTRDRGEVEADIDREMARLVNFGRGVRETLAKATADCTDRTVPAYAQCTNVLTLRSELATIEKLERARFVVGTRVQDTEIPVPTNAGEARIAKIVGVDVETVENAFLMIGIAVLAFLRLTSGALGSDKAGTDASEPATASGRGGPRIVSETPSLSVPDACALQFDSGERRGSGTVVDASPSMGDTRGHAFGDTGSDRPGKIVTTDDPLNASPSRHAAPASQGEHTAGVSPAPPTCHAATYKPTDGFVTAFYRERTHPSLGCRVRAQCLYEAYAAWCKANDIAPASMTVFGRNRPSYVRRHKTNGRIVYDDIALGNAPAPDVRLPVPAMPVHPSASRSSFRMTSASAGASVGANAGAG